MTVRPRLLSLLLLPTLVLAAGGLTAAMTTSASAANATVNQCNGVNAGTSGASTNMECDVTIVNTIHGGQRSSTTTVTRNCTLDPCSPGNGTFTSSSPNLVTRVDQCNNSSNDSAHTTRCRVVITNNISADTLQAAPVTSATINQCVGSAQGGGGTNTCAPFPATTTGADVTQCNTAANGGGGTVDCHVTSNANKSAALPITINQCNDTGNKGGNTVTCSVSLTTNITAAVIATPTTTITPTTPTPSPTSAGGSVTDVPTGGVAAGGGSTAGLQNQGWLALGAGLLALSALLLAVRRRPQSR